MAYADGTLFVPGDGLQGRSPVDGSVQWSVDVGNPKAVVADGRHAYVAAGAGTYRVNLTSKNVDWHADRVKQLQPALAVAENYVYAVGKRYGKVIALDPSSGKRRWLRRIDGEGTGAPTVADKTVIVPGESKLVGLSHESGVREWDYAASVGSSVAVADGGVFATTEGDDVFALDVSTGEELWRRAVVPGSNPPVVAGGQLYVTGTDGSIAAVSTTDGSVAWRNTVGGERSSGVAVSGGELLVADRDGQIAALAAGVEGGLSTATPTVADTPTPEPESTPTEVPSTPTATATPTSTGVPGFGLLAGAGATGAAALVALRQRWTGDDED